MLGGLGLDHHDRDVLVALVVGDDAAGDGEVEHGLGELRGLRERDPLVADEGEAHTGDRAGERQTGDLRRRGSGVDRERVVELVRRDAQDGDDDLDLVAQAVDERRTQRPVDQTAHEDRLGARTALTAEERAGDLARGVRALLDVDRQREEVEALARVLAGAGGREEHGLLVEVRGDRALGLLCEAAGLEPDDALAELAVVDDGLGELDLGTLQKGASLTCSADLGDGTRWCVRAEGSGRMSGQQ
ncbi:Uncharacterized protein Cus16_3154 [Curtobacterium sp. ER1/6]|nr:Uncharacterized protein Cus16_3154 [Curtobacterium sp. ER1/6]